MILYEHTNRFAVFSFLFGFLKGEKLGLPDLLYRKIRIVLNFSTILLLEFLYPIVSIGFIILMTVFMYIAYTDGQVNYNLPTYICWWAYYCFCAVHITATIFGLLILVEMILIYLIVKFDQVNKKLKSMDQSFHLVHFNLLKKLIDEHYFISLKTNEFNKLLTKILGIFYLGMTISIDISVYIAVYGYNPLVRALCIGLAIILYIFTNTFVLAMALVIKRAHWSYAFMNSLIATKLLSLKYKFKVT